MTSAILLYTCEPTLQLGQEREAQENFYANLHVVLLGRDEIYRYFGGLRA